MQMAHFVRGRGSVTEIKHHKNNTECVGAGAGVGGRESRGNVKESGRG